MVAMWIPIAWLLDKKNTVVSVTQWYDLNHFKEVVSPAIFGGRCDRKLRSWSCRLSWAICQLFFWCYRMPCWHTDEFIDVYRIWLPAYPSIWYIEPMRLLSKLRNLKSETNLVFNLTCTHVNPNSRYWKCIVWKTRVMSNPSLDESGWLSMLVELSIEMWLVNSQCCEWPIHYVPKWFQHEHFWWECLEVSDLLLYFGTTMDWQGGIWGVNVSRRGHDQIWNIGFVPHILDDGIDKGFHKVSFKDTSGVSFYRKSIHGEFWFCVGRNVALISW